MTKNGKRHIAALHTVRVNQLLNGAVFRRTGGKGLTF